jgi:hypothetical protein
MKRRPNYFAWIVGIALVLGYLRMGGWQQEVNDPDAVAEIHAGLIQRMVEDDR